LQVGSSPDGLAEELVALVRAEIGAVACLKQVDIVEALPKTRSGKILRKTMRGIAHGHNEPMPTTIDDPDVPHALRSVPCVGKPEARHMQRLDRAQRGRPFAG
jgi:propionyl-CoA synthetase